MSCAAEINRLSDNLIKFPVSKPYAAIIGKNPSKGARSPLLWNAGFASLAIDTNMIAIDVSEVNLFDLLSELASDPIFIGGSVAAPYKEPAAEFFCDHLTSEAKKIGAINCLFRNEEGFLCGTNSDGEASLIAFEKAFGQVTDQNILVLGAGGTGKSVAVYFASRLTDKRQMSIASRGISGVTLAEQVGCRYLNWDDISLQIETADIIINCTSLGSTIQPGLAPLSLKTLNSLKKDVIIYDVVYDPSETPLLAMARQEGFTFLNGLPMNFEQAVIGFHYAVSQGNQNLEVHKIRLAMNSHLLDSK